MHLFFGVAFFKKEKNRVTIVIAHRGTIVSHKGNILADLDIAESRKPAIMNEALEYEKQILSMKEINDEQLNVTLIHTGFSLGGYIAAACAVKPFQRVRGDKLAVVLDAPGIETLTADEYKKYENKIMNYFLVPNVINTCNKHVGKMFQIKSNLDSKNEDVEISYQLDSIAALEQEFTNTINSHSLDLFKDLTRNYAIIKRVVEWPIAKNVTGKNWSHSRKKLVR